GLLTRKMLPCERLVDDRHDGPAGDVVVRERTPPEQSNLHDIEEARSGADEERVVALRQRLSRGHSRFAPDRSTQGRMRRDTCRQDPRNSANLIEDLWRQFRAPASEINHSDA